MTYIFGPKSKNKLSEVHPDLAQVIKGALRITKTDFIVTEGMRPLVRQKQLFEKGASRTLNSRHLTGHAIDLAAWVDGEISWDWRYYESIAKAVIVASRVLDIPIEWGGNWQGLRDGPHFQLPWDKYT